MNALPERPFFQPDDPVFGLLLMAEQNLVDYRAALSENAFASGSTIAIDLLTEYIRSAQCQKVHFPPGTIRDYHRLLTALTDLGVEFPSVRMARRVFDQLRPSLHHYDFEAQGQRWWIRLRHPPAFDTPFDAPRWAFQDRRASDPVWLDRASLPPALALLALLNGEHSRADVEGHVRRHPAARPVLAHLVESGSVVDAPPVELDMRSIPPLLFLNHSTLLVRSETSAVLFDPCVGGYAARTDPRRNPFQLLNRVDAVFITHHHWDHWPWMTLARLRRDMPIYIPRVVRPSFSNVPMRAYLEFLGFSRVTEVDPGQTVPVGDIEVHTFPFVGESFGLQSIFDAFTYLVVAGGKSIYGSLDAGHSEAGTMDPIIAEVGRRRRPDLFVFGSSAQTHPSAVRASGPRYLSNELADRLDLFRYHPDTVDVERWVDLLEPRALVPYAQFIFDGQPRPDLDVGLDARAARGVFDRYWQDFPVDAGPGASEDDRMTALWYRQLRSLERVIAQPILMLHPMQGIWF
jgi:glyoxylase-like metal-dependent hydrolase (beta-lactamase superfamily II)